MMTTVFVFATLAMAVVALTQIWNDPRVTRDFRRKSYVVLALYTLFCGAGMLVLLVLVRGPGSDMKAFAGAGFMLAWIAFGGLWLTRVAPRLREPPGFLLRPWGLLDLCLLAAAFGLALAAALF